MESADDAERFMALGARAFAFYQKTGQLGALDAAVAAFQDAAEITLPDHPGRAALLSDLGNALLARFEVRGDAADLDGYDGSEWPHPDGLNWPHRDRGVGSWILVSA
jgi:hypothetical protein